MCCLFDGSHIFQMFNGCTFSSLIFHQKLIEHIEFPQTVYHIVSFIQFCLLTSWFFILPITTKSEYFKARGKPGRYSTGISEKLQVSVAKCHSIFPQVPGRSEITSSLVFPFLRFGFFSKLKNSVCWIFYSN